MACLGVGGLLPLPYIPPSLAQPLLAPGSYPPLLLFLPPSSQDSASAGTLITYYSSHYKVPLPDGHRFPMDKYGRVVEQLRGDASLHNKIDLRPAPLAELDE